MAVAVEVEAAVGVEVGAGVTVAVEVIVCSVAVAGWVLSREVVWLLMRSSRAGGSDASLGMPARSSTNAESNVERVMATTIAPKSTTGASAVVSGNSAHGESPAWVRLRKR